MRLSGLHLEGGVAVNKTESAGELDSWPHGLALSKRAAAPLQIALVRIRRVPRVLWLCPI